MASEQLQMPFGVSQVRERLRLPRVRVELVREVEPLPPIVIRSSGDAYQLLRDEAERWDRERFVTLMLDTKHQLVGIEEVSVGTVNAALVHGREIFKAIVLANANAFMVAHNHPSGIPSPSREDIEITRRLKEAAAMFGVRFLDHIIIGRDRYVSMVDDGYW